MKEKPQTPEEVLSLYSILDRCVLPAEIFEILENTKPGIGGEIQLTDAMREIAITKGMTAVEFEGKRYDMGNKFGILQAQIEIGLEHPETKDLLKDYIKILQKLCKKVLQFSEKVQYNVLQLNIGFKKQGGFHIISVRNPLFCF